MSELLTSRYVRVGDPAVYEVGGIPLPDAWWSRPYEYAWASAFCQPTDTVLDAACGIAHPFKFALAARSVRTCVCDSDERILSEAAIVADMFEHFGRAAGSRVPLKDLRRLERTCASLDRLPYESGMFDRIFLISVLEHLDSHERPVAIAELARTLHPAGQLVMTCDVPDIEPADLVDLLQCTGLTFAGPLDTERPPDALTSSMWGRPLYCFRTVAVKTVPA